MTRRHGRCRRCGRVLQLTVNGKLFLHGDRDPVWSTRVQTPSLGAHCPGSMTTEFDPPDAAAAIREARA